MILLWLAEVEVEVGDLDRARELVNMIRTRAANEEDFVPGTVRNPDSRQEYTVVVDESGAPVSIQQLRDRYLTMTAGLTRTLPAKPSASKAAWKLLWKATATSIYNGGTSRMKY